MIIYGNSPSQAKLVDFLLTQDRTVALTGPAHLGKASSARLVLETNSHPSDFLFIESGIDGIRDMIEFCRSAPLNGDHRFVLVDNACSLSEPAQDALLKLMEEPSHFVKIILVAHDVGHLLPPLRSRIRATIPWSPLHDTEMRSFADSISSIVCEPLLQLACGLPGMYRTMMESAGFEDLFQYASKIAVGEARPFLFPTPTLIKDLKGASPLRDAVAHTIRLASRKSTDRARALHMLRFCETISRSVSAVADIHWSRMAANISNVI